MPPRPERTPQPAAAAGAMPAPAGAALPRPAGPGWAGRALGLVLLLLALGGLVWTCRVAYVDYIFHTLRAPEEDNAVAVRVSYAAQLQRLLKIDPGNSEIRARMANVQAALGNADDAVRELELALRTQRAQNSLYFLAQMYEKLNRPDDALAVLADAIVLNPSDIESNHALLRLMNRRLALLKTRAPGHPELQDPLRQARDSFGLSASNWMIRSPNDPNAFLFMGNAYIEPLQPLQAYRAYLIGLGMLQQPQGKEFRLMIEPQDALNTIQQILRGRYARAYKGLP